MPLSEAVSVLRSSRALPAAVTDVEGADGAVTGRIRVQDLPDLPGPLRAATRLAGPVGVRIEDRGLAGRSWTLAVRASHPLVPLDLSSFVTDYLRGALAERHVAGVSVRAEAGQTLVEVDLDVALGPAARLVRVDRVELGEQIVLHAAAL
jgi:hypothetical protein